jgi:hypothetical protein
MKIHKKLADEAIGSASVRAADFVYSSEGQAYIILKQRHGNKLGHKLTAYELEKEIALNIEYCRLHPHVGKQEKKPKPK